MKVRINNLHKYELESMVGDIVEARLDDGLYRVYVEEFPGQWRWLAFKDDWIEFIDEEQKTYDFVNPSHYKKFEKETYQMMIDIWGEEAYIKHCEMCAFKYKLRAGEKPDQPVDRDLEKASWYLEMANKLRNK